MSYVFSRFFVLFCGFLKTSFKVLNLTFTFFSFLFFCAGSLLQQFLHFHFIQYSFLFAFFLHNGKGREMWILCFVNTCTPFSRLVVVGKSYSFFLFFLYLLGYIFLWKLKMKQSFENLWKGKQNEQGCMWNTHEWSNNGKKKKYKINIKSIQVYKHN